MTSIKADFHHRGTRRRLMVMAMAGQAEGTEK